MIAIVGAGAIGGCTAAYLRRAGHEVVLLCATREHAERINRNGLRVAGNHDEFRVAMRATHVGDLAGGRLSGALLAVKSYDTEWAVRLVLPYVARNGFVMSLQNGLNEGLIAYLVGSDRTVGCATHMTAGMFEPGVVVRYSRPDWLTFTIGELSGQRSERVHRLAELLGAVGPVAVTEDIWGALWMKLAINAMTNGLTGLTGQPTPELWVDADGLQAMVRIGAEVVAVCESEGSHMHPIHPSGAFRALDVALVRRASRGDVAALREVAVVFTSSARARGDGARGNVSSLLQDRLKGRRTEIEHLNGEVARRGMIHNLATPANAAVVSLVRRLERGELAPAHEHLRLVSRSAEAGGATW